MATFSNRHIYICDGFKAYTSFSVSHFIIAYIIIYYNIFNFIESFSFHRDLNRRRIKTAQSAVFSSRFVTDNHLIRHAKRAVLKGRIKRKRSFLYTKDSLV
jgi:hypothetical protein